MIGKSETGSGSQIICITLFFGRCYALLCLLPALANCGKMQGQNHFAEPNWNALAFIQL
jgi:hypothetical protein